MRINTDIITYKKPHSFIISHIVNLLILFICKFNFYDGSVKQLQYQNPDVKK